MDASELARSALTHAEYSVNVLKKLVEALKNVEPIGSSGPLEQEPVEQAPVGPKRLLTQPLEPEMTSIKEWDQYFRGALDVLLGIKRPAERRAALIEMKALVEAAITAIDNNERIGIE